ncbi:MAG: hypothetical protein HYX99_04430 [Chloroflexi bacterium]|nr:hypothetical protein [Chloroflexota bacterium]
MNRLALLPTWSSLLAPERSWTCSARFWTRRPTLTAAEDVPTPDLVQLEEQLLKYAQDLRALYQEEKKERERLAEERLVLQYKLQELASLNTLFQRHLEQRQRLEQAYQELVAQIRQLLSAPPGELRGQLEALLSAAETALASESQA